MYDNISYTGKNGDEYVINGDSPDFLEDFSHKVLFSIENKTKSFSFSYFIGIAHQLWENNWQVNPKSKDLMEKVKNIYLEKAKRLIDEGKEEYLDLTMTPLNTPKTIDETLKSLQG